MTSKFSEGLTESNIIVYNSSGVKFIDGPDTCGQNNSAFQDVEGKVKYVVASSDGKRVAWICNGEVCVVEAPEWKRIGTLHHPKALEVFFSPSGKYLAVFDIFSHAPGSQPTPNLYIYDVLGRKLLKSFVQKSQDGWRPQWTKDEYMLARQVNNDINFYEASELTEIKHKASFEKLKSFSLSPSIRSHHVVAFIPSVKSSPAFVQLTRYPNTSSTVARQSFFKVDAVEVMWNRTCTSALVLTTAEVDKTGASYYGEQQLFMLSTKGDSNRITFSKQGSIRSVMWCPSGKEFFCVYGSAPARASLFNIKCNPIKEFNEEARNFVMVNPPGNLVLIGGMGNISSRFEVWEIENAKKLGFRECPDITHVEWSPCGKYILTSTCSPRLRVNNGFRIWHYTTALLHESVCEASKELYSASWLPNPDANLKTFEISTKHVAGIDFAVKKASNERYVPPSKRVVGTDVSNFVDTTKKFLSQREQPMSDEDKAKALKKQKKVEKRKEAKKEKRGMMVSDWRQPPAASSTPNEKEEESDLPSKKNNNNVPKRMKNIRKKLTNIEELKNSRDSGKSLNANQLKTISLEENLLKELQELQLEVEPSN